MAGRAELCVYAVLIFVKGLAADIQTQQTVLAAVGDRVCLNCRLTQSLDVFQVTWQRILPEGEKNMASYNKYFGQRVNDGFKKKVEVIEAALQNCSIVIREVMEQDEGCYRCLFNTYPEGSFIGRTCLQLYELLPPVLHISASDSAAESAVLCSATGRPAPTVTLTVTQPHLHLSHHNTSTVTNANGTVTVTTRALLTGSHGNGAQVGCAAGVLSAPQVEVFERVPAGGFFEKLESKNDDISLTWIIVGPVLVLVFICGGLALFLWWRFRSILKGDPESKTPQKSFQEPQLIKTPLISEENEELRQRTSAKKSPDNHPKKHKTARKLFFPCN